MLDLISDPPKAVEGWMPLQVALYLFPPYSGTGNAPKSPIYGVANGNCGGDEGAKKVASGVERGRVPNLV